MSVMAKIIELFFCFRCQRYNLKDNHDFGKYMFCSSSCLRLSYFMDSYDFGKYIFHSSSSYRLSYYIMDNYDFGKHIFHSSSYRLSYRYCDSTWLSSLEKATMVSFIFVCICICICIFICICICNCFWRRHSW